MPENRPSCSGRIIVRQLEASLLFFFSSGRKQVCASDNARNGLKFSHTCSRRYIADRGASEIEAIAQNHFHDQMVGGSRQTDAEPEINFPLGREVEIHGGENLVHLLRDGIEARDRAD